MPVKRGKSKTKCLIRKSKIPDILVVEPSACDRKQTGKMEELVEKCWIMTRPPISLYDRGPMVTARRAEVSRFWLYGDGEEPVWVPPKLNNCYGPNKFQVRRQSEPPERPRVRLRTLERQSLYIP